MRDGAGAARGPHGAGRERCWRTRRLCVTWDGWGGGRKVGGGGKHKSPQQQGGSGLCPAPFQAKHAGEGCAGAAHPRFSPFWLKKPFPLGLSSLAAGRSREVPLSRARPPFSRRERALSQGYREGSRKKTKAPEEAVAASQPFPPAELITPRCWQMRRRPPGTRDVGCGMWAGSGCGSWEKTARSRVESGRERGWRRLSPS